MGTYINHFVSVDWGTSIPLDKNYERIINDNLWDLACSDSSTVTVSSSPEVDYLYVDLPDTFPGRLTFDQAIKSATWLKRWK